MEPERKIEKLLRAYAKKRRADAGNPLTLHPATRRLLQGEVARRAARPNDEESSVTLWELFRQRWALLAGFAVIVFFGAALVLPGLSAAKNKAQKTTAMTRHNLMQIGTAARMFADDNNGQLPASLDDMTNEIQPDLIKLIFVDPETGRPFVYVAAGEKLDRLSSNAVLAYSLADKKGHAVLFADGRVEVVNDQRLAELTNRGLSQRVARDDSTLRQLAEAPAELKDAGNAAVAPPALARAMSEANQSATALSDTVATTGGMLAANAPTPAAPALGGLAKAPAEINVVTPASSIQFATAAAQNFDSHAQNSFKNTIMPAKAAAVLENFRVQQNGNAIRVVDADGSVYDGSLQLESAATQNVPVQSAMTAPSGEALARNDQQPTTATRDELSAAQSYFFRVSGMNQTLKQKVVFAGNLLTMAYDKTNLQQSIQGSAGLAGGIAGSTQSTITNQLPWSNSRIAGTAILADTNNIEINAVPLSP